jgi:hypothetical protein
MANLAGITIPPLLFPTPHTGPIDDALAKDEKLHASELIRRFTGWRGENAKIARGVMGGESGFNPTAGNYCCHGLMAINVLVHAGKFGIPADKDAAIKWLQNPENNLKAAYKLWVSVGGSWQPWEAYTNGSWKLHTHTDPIITVKKNTGTEAAADAVGGAVDGLLGPVDEFISALLSPSTWFRIGKGALGGGLIILGTGAMVFVVANKSGATRAVAKAVPAGKAIKTLT